MKKWMAMLLLAVLAMSLTACGGGSVSVDESDVTRLGFSDAVSFDRIKQLEGKPVSIIGYMATMSPISGKFMYLMNLPYQSCPFCLPNTTQLSNTMAVYAPEGKTFAYTDQAIRVTGIMTIGDTVDEFGYTYNYHIADASYEIVDLSTISEDYRLWQAIATDGVVAEINNMFNYVHFLCQWTEYQGGYVDENGNQTSFFMYPGDVKNYLQDTGPHGYADKSAEGYFPGLIARIRSISESGLEDLVKIVETAKALEQVALQALNTDAFTYDESADKYVLNDNQALYDQFYQVFGQFSQWLTRWEM
ncbi:MAG: hypothetical protein U0L09_00065 [Christensenellales bacterium]|nr:hypothetical protein [Christensenellales bacterium]